MKKIAIILEISIRKSPYKLISTIPQAIKPIDAIIQPILCLKANANKAYITQTAIACPKIITILIPLFYIPNWDIIIIPNWYNNVNSILKKEIKMEFRLKELRKERNISQLKLAVDLNMNQNTISRYENMEREADYETLVKFADYFGVSVDYLLGRTENK